MGGSEGVDLKEFGVAKGRKPSLKWKNRYLEEQIHWVPVEVKVLFV